MKHPQILHLISPPRINTLGQALQILILFSRSSPDTFANLLVTILLPSLIAFFAIVGKLGN